MNKDHEIYELTDEHKAMLNDLRNDDKVDKEQVLLVKEDVARLDGYLKGRSDSDKAGPSRPNSDLTRRRSN